MRAADRETRQAIVSAVTASLTPKQRVGALHMLDRDAIRRQLSPEQRAVARKAALGLVLS